MTRYGLLADVHGNLHALEAALALLADEEVDGYLCAGDLVGYGAFPNECVERVVALPGLCVLGNHDLMALGELGEEDCAPVAQESLRWTRDVLDQTARELLARLPRHAVTPDGVLVTHGSVADPRRYVRTPTEAVGQLSAAQQAGFAVDVVVLGHTHRALAVDDAGTPLLADAVGRVELRPERRYLLNPGAVGQSRERRVHARVAILDLAQRHATFHAMDYDVPAAVRALRRHGRPPGSHHLRPRPRWKRVAGHVHARLRRAEEGRR